MVVSPDQYAAIQALYAKVYASADTGNSEGFGACFTADGTLTIQGQLANTGRCDLIARNRANTAKRVGTQRRHLYANLGLELLENGAVKGHCYFQAYDVVPGLPPILTHMGWCDDVIVREQGEWRFASRAVNFDFPS